MHPRDVMPVVELPFDAAVQTGLPEPQRPVKGVAGFVWLSDAGEDSPIAALAEPIEKLRVQLSSAAAAVMATVDIDADLDRPSIGGMKIERMSVGESDDLVVVFEDQPRVCIAGRGNSCSHLADGRDVEFPTHRAVLDVRTVDRQAPGGVLRARLTHAGSDGRHAVSLAVPAGQVRSC